MTQEYLPVAGIIGFITVLFASKFPVGKSVLPSWGFAVVGIAVAFLFIFAWWYSPLPNRSTVVVDGEPLEDTQDGYWGWSRPNRDDESDDAS